MNNPKQVEFLFRIVVKYDADVWGDPTSDQPTEALMGSDLSQRLFDGNDEFADEAVEVTYTETLDVREVQQ